MKGKERNLKGKERNMQVVNNKNQTIVNIMQYINDEEMIRSIRISSNNQHISMIRIRMSLLKSILTSFFTVFTIAIYSQNLVPNSSFEEHYSLPSDVNSINKCKYWYTPRNLSPDYFHKEATTPEYNYSSPIVSVPKNIFGYQEARNGNAYVGISNCSYPSHDLTFREMIAVKLQKQLIKDSLYSVSFYVSLAESSMYFYNIFGITLSKDSLAKVKTKFDYGEVVANNSITVKVNSIGKDTSNWHLVKTTYKANGGEQYLYIGLTRKNMNKIRYWISKYINKTGWGDELAAYYYIDDVSVIAARDESIK